jgi:rhodanese-related sulfurtransferase
MKKLIFLILVALFLPTVVSAAGWKEIVPKRVYDLLKEGSGLWLIDVRGPVSFEKAHIEGSVNIPRNVLATKSFPKNKILVLADNSLGSLQARDAADDLARRGQKRVFVLAGGIRGWQREALPVVGDAGGFELARMMPGELRQAKKAGLKFEVYDLRSQEEAEQGPIADSFVLPGKGLEERLVNLQSSLAKKGQGGLAAKLKMPVPVVVVLPAAAEARQLYQRYLWGLPGEVRVLEGGYAAWKANRGQMSISNVDGCATCPGE